MTPLQVGARAAEAIPQVAVQHRALQLDVARERQYQEARPVPTQEGRYATATSTANSVV